MRASWPGSRPRASSIFMIFSRSASIADQSKRSEIRREKKPTWRKYIRRSSPAFWPEARMAISSSLPPPRMRSSVRSSSSIPSSASIRSSRSWTRGSERLLEPLAQGLEVQEKEVEEPVERRLVPELLDQRRRQRGLERLAVGQPDLGARGERVERLRGRDADLRATEVADELEDPLVHD